VSKPWVHSHSALELFELCPKKFEGERITKEFPYKDDEKSLWGKEAHRGLEKAILFGQPLAERFSSLQWVLNSFNKVKGVKYAEMRLGVDRNRNSVDFFDDNVYYRGVGDIVIDCGKRLFCGDYKTGKKKYNNLDLARMAVLLFAKFPDAEEILSAFIWFQTRDTTRVVYRREEIDAIWEKIIEEATTVEWAIANNRFPAHDNFLCKKYCPVITCMYNGRTR
jgi:hypothetical protein